MRKHYIDFPIYISHSIKVYIKLVQLTKVGILKIFSKLSLKFSFISRQYVNHNKTFF